jgi:hypothetical protein
VFTNEWDELLSGNQKGDCINKTKQAQNSEPGEPIRIAAMEKLFRGYFEPS